MNGFGGIPKGPGSRGGARSRRGGGGDFDDAEHGVAPTGGALITGGVFKSAAYEVLSQEQRLMTSGEITKLAMERKLLKCMGKTPENTMASALYTEVRKKASTTVFIKPKEGLFGLKAWLSEPWLLSWLLQEGIEGADLMEAHMIPHANRSTGGSGSGASGPAGILSEPIPKKPRTSYNGHRTSYNGGSSAGGAGTPQRRGSFNALSTGHGGTASTGRLSYNGIGATAGPHRISLHGAATGAAAGGALTGVQHRPSLNGRAAGPATGSPGGLPTGSTGAVSTGAGVGGGGDPSSSLHLLLDAANEIEGGPSEDSPPARLPTRQRSEGVGRRTSFRQQQQRAAAARSRQQTDSDTDGDADRHTRGAHDSGHEYDSTGDHAAAPGGGAARASLPPHAPCRRQSWSGFPAGGATEASGPGPSVLGWQRMSGLASPILEGEEGDGGGESPSGAEAGPAAGRPLRRRVVSWHREMDAAVREGQESMEQEAEHLQALQRQGSSGLVPGLLPPSPILPLGKAPTAAQPLLQLFQGSASSSGALPNVSAFPAGRWPSTGMSTLSPTSTVASDAAAVLGPMGSLGPGPTPSAVSVGADREHLQHQHQHLPSMEQVAQQLRAVLASNGTLGLSGLLSACAQGRGSFSNSAISPSAEAPHGAAAAMTGPAPGVRPSLQPAAPALLPRATAPGQGAAAPAACGAAGSAGPQLPLPTALATQLAAVLAFGLPPPQHSVSLKPSPAPSSAVTLAEDRQHTDQPHALTNGHDGCPGHAATASGVSAGASERQGAPTSSAETGGAVGQAQSTGGTGAHGLGHLGAACRAVGGAMDWSRESRRAENAAHGDRGSGAGAKDAVLTAAGDVGAGLAAARHDGSGSTNSAMGHGATVALHDGINSPESVPVPDRITPEGEVEGESKPGDDNAPQPQQVNHYQVPTAAGAGGPRDEAATAAFAVTRPLSMPSPSGSPTGSAALLARLAQLQQQQLELLPPVEAARPGDVPDPEAINRIRQQVLDVEARMGCLHPEAGRAYMLMARVLEHKGTLWSLGMAERALLRAWTIVSGVGSRRPSESGAGTAAAAVAGVAAAAAAEAGALGAGELLCQMPDSFKTFQYLMEQIRAKQSRLQQQQQQRQQEQQVAALLLAAAAAGSSVSLGVGGGSGLLSGIAGLLAGGAQQQQEQQPAGIPVGLCATPLLQQLQPLLGLQLAPALAAQQQQQEQAHARQGTEITQATAAPASSSPAAASAAAPKAEGSAGMAAAPMAVDSI